MYLDRMARKNIEGDSHGKKRKISHNRIWDGSTDWIQPRCYYPSLRKQEGRDQNVKECVFATAYKNRPKVKGEINSGETMVITAGYMTVKQKVNMLKSAGAKLQLYRNSQFDANADVKPEDLEKNEMRGLDVLEGMQKTQQVQQYLENRKKEINRLRQEAAERLVKQEENIKAKAIEAEKISDLRAQLQSNIDNKNARKRAIDEAEKK